MVEVRTSFPYLDNYKTFITEKRKTDTKDLKERIMRSRNAELNDDCEIEAKRSEKMDRKREERTSETLTIFVI